MRVSIVGASGYSGLELIRLLHNHPHAQLTSIISGSQVGKRLAEIYPHLSTIIQQELAEFDAQRLAAEADLVFLATPSGVSQELVPQLLEAGLPCIDLSGDFRLKSAQTYEHWYGKAAAESRYLEQAVYGLSE